MGGQTARKSLASAPNLTLQRDLWAVARVLPQNDGGAEMCDSATDEKRPRQSVGEGRSVSLYGFYLACASRRSAIFT